MEPFSTQVLLLGFLAFFLTDLGRGELYTAIFRVQDAFIKEGRAIMLIAEAFDEIDKDLLEEDHIRDFYRFFQEVKLKHEAGVKEGAQYLEQPINTYHVVRRQADDWPNKMMLIAQESYSPIQAMYWEIRQMIENRKTWPQREDLEGVMLQLLKIQSTYLLDFLDLAKGAMNGTNSEPLTINEIYDIAKFASNQTDHHYEAVLWYAGLVTCLKHGYQGSDVTLTTALHELAKAYYKYENYHKPVEILQEALAYDPDNDTLQEDLEFYQYTLLELKTNGSKSDLNKTLVKEFQNRTYHRNSLHRYLSLCRGDTMPSSDLSCLLKASNVPYRPSKLEIMSTDPVILLFHDVISEGEIGNILTFSKPKIQYSKLGGGVERKVPARQLSETAWLRQRTGPSVIKTLSARIEERIGLRLDEPRHAEAFQVVHYGVGGMHEPHHDYFGKGTSPLKHLGNRIATWKFLLNDVTLGGDTVFPYVGVRVPAIRGAALFWPNQFLNGTTDWRTLNAACPVVVGQKWVLNKWIRERGQFDRWPCSLDRYRACPLT